MYSFLLFSNLAFAFANFLAGEPEANEEHNNPTVAPSNLEQRLAQLTPHNAQSDAMLLFLERERERLPILHAAISNGSIEQRVGILNNIIHNPHYQEIILGQSQTSDITLELNDYIESLRNKVPSNREKIEELTQALNGLLTEGLISSETEETEELEILQNIAENEFNCIISHAAMNVPVLLNKQHAYDYDSIKNWKTDPLKRGVIDRSTIEPGTKIQKEIEGFITRCEAFIAQASNLK